MNEAAWREQIYCWLSAALYLPDEDLITSDFFEVMEAALNSTGHHWRDDSLERLAQMKTEYVDAEDGSGDAVLERLAVDYSKLFVGPSSLLAPPYASFYLDGKRVCGESTVRIEDFYEREGMALHSDFPDFADHVCVMVDFLSLLCAFERGAEKMADRAESRRLKRRQKEFIDGYMLSWVPALAGRMAHYAREPFYSHTAHLLVEVLSRESEHLAAG